MSKLVSIIIPVYNVEKYLPRCIDSILNQTYKDLEIVCVNDGSTDNSLSIIKEYEKKDSRIKVFDKDNGGAASARNYALENVYGEYITFVDPDDWIENEMYETIIDRMEDLSAGIGCCGFYKNWDGKESEMKNSSRIESGLFGREQFFLYSMKRFEYRSIGGYLWNKVFRKEVIGNNKFDENLHVGEDVLFYAQCVMNSEKNTYLDEPLYHYYQRTDSLCHNCDIEARSGSLTTYETLVHMFENEGFCEELILFTKRFYTYHASLLTEKAYIAHDVINMKIMQNNIGKYLDAYIKTSGEHFEWNKKMELMQIDPEKAITYSRNLKDAERRNSYAVALKKPIKEDHILYESFFGRGMVCCPYAMFLSIEKSIIFQNYIHIWSISNKEELARLEGEYKDYKNVKFVLRSSNEYVEYLATCKYLINNDNFFYFFVKRDEQIYLNTWHGIPMKKLGYDVPDGILGQHNTFRNFRMTDYLLGWNEHMQKVLEDAYSLNSNYSGEILLSGCPRNDITLGSDRNKVINSLIKHGINIEKGKKIVLYAPTFRGENLQNTKSNITEILEFLNELEKSDINNEYIFFFKPHHLVYQAILDENVKDPRIIPAFMDANEIMSISDILISDYSSIYLDYLVTGRPIVFYIHDEKEYKEYRGLYYDSTNLPGKVCRNIEEVTEFFKDITVCDEYKNTYDEYIKWACSLDDGHVCERIWKKILNGNGKKNIMERKCEILLLCSSLYNDKSFEKLIENINYYKNKFKEVTVLFDQPKSDYVGNRILCRIKNVRGLSRVTAMPLTYSEEILLNKYLNCEYEYDENIKEIFIKERKRCLYNMVFSKVIPITDDRYTQGMYKAITEK